ncbi:MAG: DNA repair protein RadC [Chthoniobacterales bacterium]
MSALRIREIPHHDRPRERLIASGASTLNDSELLAIFIRTGVNGRNAIEVASELLRKHGSLADLSRCSAKEIMTHIKGIGMAKAAELCAAFEVGKRLARERPRRERLDTPEAIYEVMAQELQSLHHESLRILLLDTRLQLIRIEEISRGSLNESIAHPREILRPALIYSAYGVVLVHNHPSGDPSPSEADRRLTVRLNEAAELLQIKFLDHLIIGSPETGRLPYFSFKESGIL